MYNTVSTMYNSTVTTPAEAYCHLFFHCCLEDRTERKESAYLATSFVENGIAADVNLDEQLEIYNSYRSFIKNETDFIQYLIDVIQPQNPLLLYCYCVEIILSNGKAGPAENRLINLLAYILDIHGNQEKNTKDSMEYRWKMIYDSIPAQ